MRHPPSRAFFRGSRALLQGFCVILLLLCPTRDGGVHQRKLLASAGDFAQLPLDAGFVSGAGCLLSTHSFQPHVALEFQTVISTDGFPRDFFRMDVMFLRLQGV